MYETTADLAGELIIASRLSRALGMPIAKLPIDPRAKTPDFALIDQAGNRIGYAEIKCRATIGGRPFLWSSVPDIWISKSKIERMVELTDRAYLAVSDSTGDARAARIDTRLPYSIVQMSRSDRHDPADREQGFAIPKQEFRLWLTP